MAEQKVSFTISAVDRASEMLDRVNKRLAASHAPVERLNKQWTGFLKQSGLDGVTQRVRGLASAGLDAFRSVSRVVGPLGVITSAASIAGMARLVEQWGEFGQRLGFSAARIGTTAGQLQSLQGAARLAGGSAAGITSALTTLGQTMTDAIGGRAPEAVVMFNTLGIAFQDAAGRARPVTEVLPEIADKVKGIRDPFLQARIATSLLGGAAEELLPFLRLGSKGMAEYTAMAQRYGVMNDAGAAAANRLRMAQVQAGLAVEGLGNSIAEKLAPVVGPLLTDMADWIAANREWIATGIGDAVRDLSAWLRQVDWKRIAGDVRGAVTQINGIAQAFGGWVRVAEILIGLKIAGWVGGMVLPLARLIGLLWKVVPAAETAGQKLGGMQSKMSSAGLQRSGLFAALQLGSMIPDIQEDARKQDKLTVDDVAAGRAMPDGFSQKRILADAKKRFGADTAGFEQWSRALDDKGAQADGESLFGWTGTGTDWSTKGVSGAFGPGGLLGRGLTPEEQQAKTEQRNRVLATLPGLPAPAPDPVPASVAPASPKPGPSDLDPTSIAAASPKPGPPDDITSKSAASPPDPPAVAAAPGTEATPDDPSAGAAFAADEATITIHRASQVTISAAQVRFQRSLADAGIDQRPGSTQSPLAPVSQIRVEPAAFGRYEPRSVVPPAAEPPEPAVSHDAKDPRGIRNNNWLNLSYVRGQLGLDQANPSDGRFGRYATPEAGIASATRQLWRLAQRGLDSIARIIPTWAPSSENNTAGYIDRVAKQVGVDPHARLDLHDPVTVAALEKAMAQVETGRRVDDSVIDRGIAMAEGTSPRAPLLLPRPEIAMPPGAKPGQALLRPQSEIVAPAGANSTQQLMTYFQSQGWSKAQAAGIAANLTTESALRPNAIGDGGAAYGIGQWHADRQAAFKTAFGRDIQGSSLLEQAKFVQYELTHGEKRAGQHLALARSAAEAGAIVSSRYERPRDVEGNELARGRLAERIAAGMPDAAPVRAAPVAVASAPPMAPAFAEPMVPAPAMGAGAPAGPVNGAIDVTVRHANPPPGATVTARSSGDAFSAQPNVETSLMGFA